MDKKTVRSLETVLKGNSIPLDELRRINFEDYKVQELWGNYLDSFYHQNVTKPVVGSSTASNSFAPSILIQQM